MPKRIIILSVISFVFLIVIMRSLLGNSAAPPPAVPTTQVMVAAADIVAGDFIRADYHIAFVAWPQSNLTESMLTDATVKLSDFEGAVARRSIAKGEVISRSVLVKSDEGGFMSAVLEPGKRAVSLAVDLTTGNAGFIFPGDQVDLILTHTTHNGPSSVLASETIIEDVRVLAVDQQTDNPGNKAILARTVTLEVSPKQAETINVARDLGKINLSLRSLVNKESSDAATGATPEEPLTFDDVLRGETGGPAENTNVTRDTDVSKIIRTETNTVTRVQLIRGSEKEEVDFGSQDSKNTRDE